MENNDLDYIIKNNKRKKSIYIKFDPNNKIKNLLVILDKETNNRNLPISWNKLDNGTKKKRIIEYLEGYDDGDHLFKRDLERNMYNGQLNKIYLIDYNVENNKVNNVTKN